MEGVAFKIGPAPLPGGGQPQTVSLAHEGAKDPLSRVLDGPCPAWRPEKNLVAARPPDALLGL